MDTDTPEQDSTHEQASDTSSEELQNNESQHESTSEDNAGTPNALAMSDEEVMDMVGPEDLEHQPSDRNTSNIASDDGEAENSDTEDSDTQEQSTAAEERDIAAEHAKIFAPIKAGGKEIEIRSVDEAISLMQKGADYHRKTEELSAHRKTIATLEKAGIKPDDLNHLIDLHNKDPQAIKKLVADAEIDILDLDINEEDSKNYQPKQHTISDIDLALDDTLKALESTPTYNQLITVVGDQWDDNSRSVVANNPNLLNVINDHIAVGIYDVIDKEVTRQRALGNLQGLDDITAYQSVGEQIDQAGGFKHLITDEQRAQKSAQSAKSPAKLNVSRPRQDGSDVNLNAKRRAASPTKAASSNPRRSQQANPMGLSDAEFMKQIGSSL